MSGPERPGPAVEMRQLLPEAKTTTVGELVGSLEFGASAHSDRPYVVANFVASVDGRTAFHGRSAGLSDLGDRAMFHGLRESVDAVFAGTTTMREEGYGRLVRDPSRRERRVEAGLSADPLACLMSLSGDVPTGIPLFADPDSRVVVFSPVAVDLSGVRAEVEVVRLEPGRLTLASMLERLHSDWGVRSLLCEGGATVFGAMLREAVVDELFLTLAPRLAGGSAGPGLTAGHELPELVGLRPVWALERAGSLFMRYALG